MNDSQKIRMLNEYKFLKLMQNEIISRLDGSHAGYDKLVITSRPSKLIILGTLCALDADQIKKNETSSKVNSISVSFLTKKFTNLKVKPKFSVFYQTERIEEKSLNQEEKGVTLKGYDKYYYPTEEYELNSTNINSVVNIESLRKIISEGCKIDLKKVPEWNPELELDITQYEQDEQKLELVTVYLINKTTPNTLYETTLFEVQLEIELDEDIIPFEFEYSSNGFIEKDCVDIQCNNCAAQYDKNNKKILTSNYKEFVSQKIEPKINLLSLNGEEISFKFEDLANKDKRYNILDRVVDVFDEYILHYQDNRPKDDSSSYKKYNTYENIFKELRERYNESLNILKNDTQADYAFELMQKAFSKASKYKNWRLFQIIFIINCIGDILQKRNSNVAELLHVDTGGGKSEAYFGLVAFCSFYDRLRGKSFGVTAITKFPLRMLSVQQLQRIAKLFIWAEEIRKEEKILGEPFSVAYFVGSSIDFPNKNKEIIINLRKEKLLGKIIQECPVCKGKVIQRVNENDLTIVHTCAGCHRDYFLYYTDEEIYRKLPTFIIATVDKLAGVSFNRRFRNIFGGALCQCKHGHGFIPAGDICEPSSQKCEDQGKEIYPKFSTGPTLMIQDEMHLIREGFGSIDSHFETFLETMQKKFTGEGFKNIAMTATISGADYQIKQLYNKKVRIFPGQSPMGKGKFDFFFELNEDIPHRICLGLRPNVRENRYAVRATFTEICHFIELVETDKEKYSQLLDISKEELTSILGYYKSYLSYHNKKDDIQNMHYYLMHQSDEVELVGDESDYKLVPKTLTGEDTLDDIRELINTIESQDTEKTKELIVVFATNIVSHGVDIEKWNVMCFQGIPRSTAEYIQALSRIGRQHVGLVMLWFYPTRVRDLSTFSKFREYNQNIEHHVEKVPILRWAKLGFHQTFNSLFCGAILNYFSNLLNRPIYKVEHVNEVFSQPNSTKNRDLLKQLLEEAYCTYADPEAAKYFLDNIASEMEKRLNKLIKYNGPEKNNFPSALADTREPYFSNQFGMRGIQSSLVLTPNTEQATFIRSYYTKDTLNQDE